MMRTGHVSETDIAAIVDTQAPQFARPYTNHGQHKDFGFIFGNADTRHVQTEGLLTTGSSLHLAMVAAGQTIASNIGGLTILSHPTTTPDPAFADSANVWGTIGADHAVQLFFSNPTGSCQELYRFHTQEDAEEATEQPNSPLWQQHLVTPCVTTESHTDTRPLDFGAEQAIYIVRPKPEEPIGTWPIGTAFGSSEFTEQSSAHPLVSTGTLDTSVPIGQVHTMGNMRVIQLNLLNLGRTISALSSTLPFPMVFIPSITPVAPYAFVDSAPDDDPDFKLVSHPWTDELYWDDVLTQTHDGELLGAWLHRTFSDHWSFQSSAFLVHRFPSSKDGRTLVHVYAAPLQESTPHEAGLDRIGDYTGEHRADEVVEVDSDWQHARGLDHGEGVIYIRVLEKGRWVLYACNKSMFNCLEILFERIRKEDLWGFTLPSVLNLKVVVPVRTYMEEIRRMREDRVPLTGRTSENRRKRGREVDETVLGPYVEVRNEKFVADLYEELKPLGISQKKLLRKNRYLTQPLVMRDPKTKEFVMTSDYTVFRSRTSASTTVATLNSLEELERLYPGTHAEFLERMRRNHGNGAYEIVMFSDDKKDTFYFHVIRFARSGMLGGVGGFGGGFGDFFRKFWPGGGTKAPEKPPQKPVKEPPTIKATSAVSSGPAIHTMAWAGDHVELHFHNPNRKCHQMYQVTGPDAEIEKLSNLSEADWETHLVESCVSTDRYVANVVNEDEASQVLYVLRETPPEEVTVPWPLQTASASPESSSEHNRHAVTEMLRYGLPGKEPTVIGLAAASTDFFAVQLNLLAAGRTVANGISTTVPIPIVFIPGVTPSAPFSFVDEQPKNPNAEKVELFGTDQLYWEDVLARSDDGKHVGAWLYRSFSPALDFETYGFLVHRFSGPESVTRGDAVDIYRVPATFLENPADGTEPSLSIEVHGIPTSPSALGDQTVAAGKQKDLEPLGEFDYPYGTDETPSFDPTWQHERFVEHNGQPGTLYVTLWKNGRWVLYECTADFIHCVEIIIATHRDTLFKHFLLPSTLGLTSIRSLDDAIAEIRALHRERAPLPEDYFEPNDVAEALHLEDDSAGEARRHELGPYVKYWDERWMSQELKPEVSEKLGLDKSTLDAHNLTLGRTGEITRDPQTGDFMVTAALRPGLADRQGFRKFGSINREELNELYPGTHEDFNRAMSQQYGPGSYSVQFFYHPKGDEIMFEIMRYEDKGAWEKPGRWRTTIVEPLENILIRIASIGLPQSPKIERTEGPPLELNSTPILTKPASGQWAPWPVGPGQKPVPVPQTDEDAPITPYQAFAPYPDVTIDTAPVQDNYFPASFTADFGNFKSDVRATHWECFADRLALDAHLSGRLERNWSIETPKLSQERFSSSAGGPSAAPISGAHNTWSNPLIPGLQTTFNHMPLYPWNELLCVFFLNGQMSEIFTIPLTTADLGVHAHWEINHQRIDIDWTLPSHDDGWYLEFAFALRKRTQDPRSNDTQIRRAVYWREPPEPGSSTKPISGTTTLSRTLHTKSLFDELEKMRKEKTPDDAIYMWVNFIFAEKPKELFGKRKFTSLFSNPIELEGVWAGANEAK